MSRSLDQPELAAPDRLLAISAVVIGGTPLTGGVGNISSNRCASAASGSVPVEVRSVTKAIRLLEELAKERGDCGVSELARTLGMDKSSVSRMLRTLEQSGFVSQDATTQRYALGLNLAVLGYRALKRVNLRDSSRPTLESLAAETGECSHLAVMAEDRAFYVEQVSPAWGVSVDAPVGTLAPLYCTALGKVLLAWQPGARQDQLFSEMTFESFTRRRSWT